jgi:hypothetical protein
MLGALAGYYLADFRLVATRHSPAKLPTAGAEKMSAPAAEATAPTAPAVAAQAPAEPGIDLPARLAEILLISDRRERIGACIALFGEMRLEDVAAIKTHLNKIAGHPRYREVLGAFMLFYTGLDPDAACAFADTHTGRLGEMVMGTAVRQRCRVDPEAAWQWIAAHAAGSPTHAIWREALAGYWSSGNLGAATDFYLDLPGRDILRHDLVTLTGRHLEQGGVEAALHWLEQVRERHPDRLAETTEALVRLWSSDAPAEAFNWLLQDAAAAPQLVELSAQRWAERDRQQALAYLADMETGPLRSAVAGGIMEAWVRAEPSAAMDWAQDQDWGAERDTVLAAVARGVGRLDPAGAIAWAEVVEDPAARRELIVQIAAAWNVKDPLAVTEWLRNQDLTPQEKSRIVTSTAEDLQARESAQAQGSFVSRNSRYRYP